MNKAQRDFTIEKISHYEKECYKLEKKADKLFLLASVSLAIVYLGTIADMALLEYGGIGTAMAAGISAIEEKIEQKNLKQYIRELKDKLEFDKLETQKEEAKQETVESPPQYTKKPNSNIIISR